MNRQKYLRLFLDEARENLSAYANEVVQCEKGREHTDSESIAQVKSAFDAIFRAAHSLKGMAASMEFDSFTHLAHLLEDVADLGRKGVTLDAEAYDVLLAAGDRLEEMLDWIEAGNDGELDAGELPARIEACLHRFGEKNSEPAPSASFETVATAPFFDEGQTCLRVQMDPGASMLPVRAFMVHRALSSAEAYRSTYPAPEILKNGDIPGACIFFVFDAGVDVLARLTQAAALQAVENVSVHDPASAAAVEQKPEIDVAHLAAPSLAVSSVSISQTSAVQGAFTGDSERTVRIRIGLLDQVIDSVGELLLARSRLRVLAKRHQEPELDDLVDEIGRLTRDLHDSVVRARMTPLSFITGRFPKVVRDLSRHLERRVDFELDGIGIELDRAILDELGTPLLHMLRNAVDHGYDGAEARVNAGKPEAMQLLLRGRRVRDRVLVELKDDGAGLDVAALKARAVRRGLLDDTQASALSEREAFELICAPGFSTREAVSETSGRGVGMDVVKASMERLGGTLRIDSELGQGTTFTLDLPLTIAILDVLVVEIGDRQPSDAFALPIARVERALDLTPHLLRRSKDALHLLLDDTLVPLYDLGALLGFAPAQEPGSGTALIVERPDGDIAFRVTGVVGQEEVVAKPLGPPLNAFGYLTGAALLADGRAAYILELVRLVEEDRLDRRRLAAGAA